MTEERKNAFVTKGHGYATYTESQGVVVMSKNTAEDVARLISGEEYTLMTVNSNTDNRKARPDPRVYTFLLTSTYVKQQAKRLAKARRND